VQIDDQAKEPRLVIPRRLLKSARKVAAVDVLTDTRHAGAISAQAFGWGAAVVAGFGAMGLAFVRFGRRPALGGLALALALVGCLGIGRCLIAAPEPEAKKAADPPLVLDGMAVEFTDEGDTIRLIVPRAKLPDLARQLKANGL
jgi:hypothetical protein